MAPKPESGRLIDTLREICGQAGWVAIVASYSKSDMKADLAEKLKTAEKALREICEKAQEAIRTTQGDI
jgi:hypothetical protein